MYNMEFDIHVYFLHFAIVYSFKFSPVKGHTATVCV